MAKDDKKKKNPRYSRDPSTVSGTALKGIKNMSEEVLKSGKKLINNQKKLTPAAKDILAIKSVTDPADKLAIKAAKSGAGKKAILESKATQNAMIRNTKNIGKRASKESQVAFNERAMKAQASQNAQKIKDKNYITKQKIKSARAEREASKIPPAIPKKAAPSAPINERRLPDSKDLKPVSSKNIKQSTEVPSSIEPKVPMKKVITGKTTQTGLTGKQKAIAGGVAVGAAGVALQKAGSKPDGKTNSAVAVPKAQKPINIEDVAGRKKGEAPKASPRNDFNAKKPAEVKAPVAPKQSVDSAYDAAVNSPSVKKKTGGKIAPSVRAGAREEARKYIAAQKKSGVPWEKILESLTMIMSSYILSRGVSKRYK